ncbi:MAG: SPOR domain-containing protein [Paludibacter sp.]|nr:SPOR domain-containing protein [Paludibacter sp.]
MKKFFQYIENLLIRNDYVIVPNLGGFVVQQQSSEIQGNTIIPPFAVVGFNPLLQHSDGLLEMEIARTEQIAYRQAVDIINDNVSKIRNLLQYGEIVVVGKIGKITQNNGTLIFSPADDFQFLPANFNLQKVDFHFINNKNKHKEKPITLTLYPKTMLRYAASFALIVGFLGAQPFLDKKPQQASFVNMLNNINTPTIEIAEFTAKNQDITEEQTENIPAEKQETAKNFHIIIGCFKTRLAAENYANLLKTNGLQIDIEIFSSENLQRVSAGSFATFDEAKNALENLKNSDKVFENVWIMCKKM